MTISANEKKQRTWQKQGISEISKTCPLQAASKLLLLYEAGKAKLVLQGDPAERCHMGSSWHGRGVGAYTKPPRAQLPGTEL